MNRKKQKILNQLEGKTVESLTHAGTVTVHNGQLVMDNDVFEPNPDTGTLEELLIEWKAEFDMIPFEHTPTFDPELLGTNPAVTAWLSVPNFQTNGG